MSPRALVVEDDPHIVEVIEDSLVSLGHSHVWVNNLHDARNTLATEEFAYVLLDLEFPAKPKSKLASKESGALLLEEIQQLKGFKRLPVIVMSGHLAYCLNRTTELRDKGAFNFIAKPFPTESHTLPSVIRAALKSRPSENGAGRTSNRRPNGKPLPFEGGEVTLYSNRIEICGVDILVSKTMRKVLAALSAMRPTTGSFVAYPGAELAELAGCERGQNGIAEMLRDFRDRTAERLLDEANVICGRFDIVQSGGPGYRFNPWLKIHCIDGSEAGTQTDAGDTDDTVNDPATALGDPGNDTDDPASDSANDPANERQAWIISELRKGGEIRVATVVSRFRCSSITAKRDLAELRKRNLIRFEGPSRTGSYRLVQRRRHADRRAS